VVQLPTGQRKRLTEVMGESKGVFDRWMKCGACAPVAVEDRDAAIFRNEMGKPAEQTL
jgi:hypothetical protein